ncbi:MAG: hypothetical protein QM612_05085 [Thermomonas sp.]|uniref:hypothetical protein n=1 Tax=Thermomonas sp. TaxID=1971895 RepID=UPI0039E3D2A8
MWRKVAKAIPRWIFGLFWLLLGSHRLYESITGAEIAQFAEPEAQAFYGQLMGSGFINPLLGASFAIAGLCLLFHRTTPLGIILLAPSILVISFFHIAFTGAWIWGSFFLVFLLVLAWLYRDAFRPLWNYKGS